MEIGILFEDDDVLAISKPPGMVVNRSQTVTVPTVQNWAEQKLGIHIDNPAMPWGDAFESRAGIVHRLDKETSGVLLIAKNPDSFIAMQAQFKERVVQKTYLAIAHGVPEPRTGCINAPVGRLPWNRERFGVLAQGKEAQTDYEVLQYPIKLATKQDASLIVLYPKTGRTHQIRVHLKYINHPIVGDMLYAGRKTARDDRRFVSRVMLHAWKLTCTHPKSGQSLAFESPIPDDMNSVITQT